MAETITPEQRAHDVATFLNLPDDGIALRVIIAAIRAAETAAVEAERDRCAEAAFEGQKGLSCFVSAKECVAYNRGRRDAAEDIRRTPTTEADNAR